MDFQAVLDEVALYGARYVCVTGGEPLAQKNCLNLLRLLCDAGYQVSLETGGAHDIGRVDDRVSRVMDIKTPGSGECEGNIWSNLALMQIRDTLKFVICDRADYEWSRAQVRERQLSAICEVIFSPAWGQVQPRDMAEWILQDRLDVRMQVQLHKLIWGEAPGH